MPRRNQQQNNQAANDDADPGRHIPNEIPGGSKSFLCCVPTGCAKGPIREENLWEAVKIVCNNDACTLGPYMHKECFEEWEETVLTFLRSCGRARSWSEKQRHQNLWTKKGYDLAFKACGCSCARGHLKKDLNWLPPRPRINHENDAKKRKRKNKQNALPVLGQGVLNHHNHNHNNNNHAGSPPRVNGVAPAGAHAMANNNGQYQQPQQQQQQQQPMVVNNGGVQEPPRPRTSSMSSTGSSTCSPGSGSTSGIDSPSSPVHSTGGQGRRKSSNFEFFGDRARHGSGGNGGFIKRIDYTSFNVLPRHKINSYHIKMEDDGHGNDEIRAFILGTLGAAKVNKVSCCLCYTSMSVFDRYPLIDGTFFLSPRQHSNHCLEVKRDNRIEYLSSVCMGCLEGWGSQLKCRGCAKPWDGSHLLLGSMYTYDIFSSDPCCAERLKCTRCSQPVINPEHRLAFFSDYSRPYPCQVCKYIDYHFAKPLSVAYAPKKPTPPPIAAIIHQHSVNATRQAAAAAAMSNGVILAHPSGAHYNPYHPNFSSPYHLTRSASIGSAPPKTATPSPPPHPGPAHARPPLQQQFSLPLPGAMMRPRQPDSPPLLSVVPNMRIPPPPLFSSVPPAARLYQQPPPIHRRHCTGLLGDIQHQMSSLAIVAES